MTVVTHAGGLSARGSDLSNAGGFVDKFNEVLGDPYDADTNPKGFLNLGTAENYTMCEENAKFINENIKFVAEDFSYGTGPWGTARLRKAMASYINRLLKPHTPLRSDDLLFANGVTSLCEMLGFTICDQGDMVLLSRPIYQAFKADFGSRAKVGCEYVSFGDADQFDIEAIPKYEEAIKCAAQSGKQIKGIVLCNPHNPLGRCYTPEALKGYMKLCDKYSIHLVVDEIYAMSVFDVPDDPKAVPFHSVLSYDTTEYIRPDYIHHLYGMSKDLAGGGIRLGCFHTRNQSLMRAMKAITQFSWSGNGNERIATLMLEDEKWIDSFLATSRKRLAQKNVLVRQLLDRNGIKYSLGANAGFFIWIDLRPWLDRNVQDQDDIWKAEDALTAKLFAAKVYITNGKELSAEEPGWYRFIFSQHESAVREGIKRIVQVTQGKQD